MTDETAPHSLRPATASDAGTVSGLVDRAYRHYVDRIGMEPGPMTEDYAEVIRDKRVTLAERDGEIVGLLVLDVDEEGFVVNNVAVDPAVRGTGLGRTLLELAQGEARRAGFDSIYLYTHEGMTENIDLYERIGYVQYDRRSFGDFSLIFMRKPLGRSGRIRGLPSQP